MLVSYDDYTALGYNTVPLEMYDDAEIYAEAWINKLTFGRVTPENITEINKRGVCKIIDMQYNDTTQENAPVVSFNNEGYSETRAINTTSAQKSTDQKAYEIVSLYFTADQRYRGTNSV